MYQNCTNKPLASNPENHSSRMPLTILHCCPTPSLSITHMQLDSRKRKHSHSRPRPSNYFSPRATVNDASFSLSLAFSRSRHTVLGRLVARSQSFPSLASTSEPTVASSRLDFCPLNFRLGDLTRDSLDTNAESGEPSQAPPKMHKSAENAMMDHTSDFRPHKLLGYAAALTY